MSARSRPGRIMSWAAVAGRHIIGGRLRWRGHDVMTMRIGMGIGHWGLT